MPTTTALSDEDIRRRYYETAGHQKWITEMQLDPLQLIVCDDTSGKYYRVGVTITKGEIGFGEPTEVAIQYVDSGSKLSAIVYDNRAESLSGVASDSGVATLTVNTPATAPTTSAASPSPVVADGVSPAGAAIRKMAAVTGATTTQTPPATPAGGTTTTLKEASGMPFDPAKLREALGLSETASATEALAAFATALTTLGGGQNPTAVTPTDGGALSAGNPNPVVVPQLADGNRPILLDPTQFAELQASARKGETAWAQLRRNERDGVLDEAIKLGKFPAARRDYWVTLWNNDPDGTRAAVDALASNVIPVLAAGYLGDDTATRSAADLAFEGLYGKVG